MTVTEQKQKMNTLVRQVNETNEKLGHAMQKDRKVQDDKDEHRKEVESLRKELVRSCDVTFVCCCCFCQLLLLLSTNF